MTRATLQRSARWLIGVCSIVSTAPRRPFGLRSTDSLLGVRHLNPNLPTDAGAYVTFRLDEERRLAYTAMTRASRRVVWTATTAGAEPEPAAA